MSTLVRNLTVEEAQITLFIKYLHKYMIYDDFIANLRETNKINDNNSIQLWIYLLDYIKHSGNICRVISRSFDWSASNHPENIPKENRHTFWLRHHEDFIDIGQKFLDNFNLK